MLDKMFSRTLMTAIMLVGLTVGCEVSQASDPYADVQLTHLKRPFDLFQSTSLTPVAVEMRDNSEDLLEFNHPANALYIFGPEDGSVSHGFLSFSHRFVKIPTKHCLNLATAISVVMWDRILKA